jgi:hypothetical protein
MWETDTDAGHAPDYDRAAYKGPQRQSAKKVCRGPVGQQLAKIEHGDTPAVLFAMQIEV